MMIGNPYNKGLRIDEKISSSGRSTELDLGLVDDA